MKNAVCPLEFEALARRNKKEWLLEFSPRKARKLYSLFFLFVPFALFAVHRIQTECPV